MDREHALMIVKCYKEAILPLLANAKVYLYGSCSRKSPILLSQAGWGLILSWNFALQQIPGKYL